jgi:pilus assembly protein CpaE
MMHNSKHASGSQHIPSLPRVSIQVFCETSDLSQAVQASTSDRRMDKVHLKVQMGGGAAAVEAYRHSPTPNVIVLETVTNRNEIIEYLDSLSEVCDAGTKVVVIGHVNDVLLYRELMRRGVSEYLIAPVSSVDFISSLSNLFAASDAAPLGRSIAVLGTRGGVGSSTIAHNLSYMIARHINIETVIVDLDLAFGTAGLDFNQDPPQGIAEAVFAPDRIDANLVDRLLSRCTDFLSLLSAPAMLDRVYDFNENSFDSILEVLKSTIPMIVLDVPHVWTAWTRRLVTSSDEIFIVASPDLASLRNAKNMFDTFALVRQNDNQPKLIMNMVGMPKRPEISVAEFAKNLDVQVAATINFDPALFGTASNNGQMIAEMQARSKAAETFLELASLITGRAEAKAQKKSILEPLLSKLSKKKA